MAPSPIHFYSEEIHFNPPLSTDDISLWISQVVAEEDTFIDELSYVFCTDEYLLNLNKTYLAHDEYTDILTFDYHEENGIKADIFISVQRVDENAQIYGYSFAEELLRVIVHGILHLRGYSDKEIPEKELMRKKEDYYLAQIVHKIPEGYRLEL